MSSQKGMETRGDAALAQAIATGAPVPTTETQAAELTQKWGVWCQPNGEARGSWVVQVDGNTTKIGYDTIEEAERHRSAAVEQSRDEDDEYTVRPYPTPPPTPPASSGGEWKVFKSGVANLYLVTNGTPEDEFEFQGSADDEWPRRDAEKLASRLNAADAMEQAVKFAIAMLDRDMPPSNITAVRERLLEAALRK